MTKYEYEYEFGFPIIIEYYICKYEFRWSKGSFNTAENSKKNTHPLIFRKDGLLRSTCAHLPRIGDHPSKVSMLQKYL